MSAGTLSYATATLAFVALGLVLTIGWRGRSTGLLFVLAALASAVWSGLNSAAVLAPSIPQTLLIGSESVRNAAWLGFLWWLLWDGLRFRNRFSILLGLGAVALTGTQLAMIAVSAVSGSGVASETAPMIAGNLAVVIIGLILIEHVFRLTRPDNRWSIKYLCLGLGSLFAFDFYLYSDALLFLRIEPGIQDARGFVNALVVPLLAVSAARNPAWSLDVYVSRSAVFHTATLLGAGAYLVLMAAAGYYLRVFGGDWGIVLQTAFLAAAIILLFGVLLSRQLRSRLRVFISRHFFNYKFDYREEWLRFTRTLSTGATSKPLGERIVTALAATVHSPGGRLWAREGTEFQPRATSRGTMAELPVLDRADGLITYLDRTEWVVILDEYRQHPERYENLALPDWLTADARVWIIVPLLHEESLQGFVILDRPDAALTIDWEVRDLLKTAGRQAASHLAQLEAVQALALARQFESFNRLSAYVIHDLKNLIAQLSLVVSNAARHGDKPEFLRDAIGTVDNAVARMNRLIQQLRSGDPTGRIVPVEAAGLARETVTGFGDRQPPVNLAVEAGVVRVLADRDRLRSVLGHLIQNALDATPKDGRITVRVHRDGSDALIDVEDSGCGMDADFVRNRLFRPFDTTKGMAGMGIGAFESREYLRTLGGDLEVRSQPRQGSRFRMRIPLANQQIIERGAA